ncbi:MAG: leucyl/phenylalanyl-tRNA--protein transferase [Thermodesulfovibrionales bacterium]|nr:leucyl/phenylalanyl-tRNA--protein transferase [Thermodesulfovibrionales bacterium]
MPVFVLNNKIVFPNPNLAEYDGLLAIGGDFSKERLLKAYEMGIFPWYDEQSPILWWSPEPRLILIPSEIKVSRSLKSLIRKSIFEVTFDCAFKQVIQKCAFNRLKSGQNTWITNDMISAYIELHEEGYAHSVECWLNGRLVGGLYGVSLGRAFFGESMFSEISNTSKIALVKLAERLCGWGFSMIDCQIVTSHLVSMGAKTVSREEFLNILKISLQHPTIRGKWSFNTTSSSQSQERGD